MTKMEAEEKRIMELEAEGMTTSDAQGVLMAEQMKAGPPACEACLEPMDMVGYFGGYTVCMSCVKARQQAVLKRKCSCGKKRRETPVKKMGSRTWISCFRCLGQVKQLS